MKQIVLFLYFWDGYSISRYDSCIYYKHLWDCSFIYLLLFLDDMLIAANNRDDFNKLKAQLHWFEFEMKDLGATYKILRMEIQWDR